jgi:hypothetical protein
VVVHSATAAHVAAIVVQHPAIVVTGARRIGVLALVPNHQQSFRKTENVARAMEVLLVKDLDMETAAGEFCNPSPAKSC